MKIAAEARVKKLKAQLLNEIQNFCRGQVDIWLQVPELALKANLIKGLSCGRYNLAHLCQLWPVFPSFMIDGLCVNLRTGELGSLKCLDEIQLGYLSVLLDHLDADKVVNLLQAEINS